MDHYVALRLDQLRSILVEQRARGAIHHHDARDVIRGKGVATHLLHDGQVFVAAPDLQLDADTCSRVAGGSHLEVAATIDGPPFGLYTPTVLLQRQQETELEVCLGHEAVVAPSIGVLLPLEQQPEPGVLDGATRPASHRHDELAREAIGGSKQRFKLLWNGARALIRAKVLTPGPPHEQLPARQELVASGAHDSGGLEHLNPLSGGSAHERSQRGPGHWPAVLDQLPVDRLAAWSQVLPPDREEPGL